MTQAYIDPDREAWAIFKTLPKGQPINMLNLIRLRAKAEYPADHPDHGKDLTGRDAYRAYGRTTAHIFARVGGRQVWVGKPEVMVTGPQDEAWDIATNKSFSRMGGSKRRDYGDPYSANVILPKQLLIETIKSAVSTNAGPGVEDRQALAEQIGRAHV